MRGKLTIDEYNRVVINDASDKERSKDSKLLQCYKYFKEEFKSKRDDEKADLFNRLLDVNNKILVVIDLSEKEDEQFRRIYFLSLRPDFSD